MSPASPPHVSDTDRTVRHTWSESDRFVPRAFVRPFQRFMDLEAAGGIALLVSAVIAIVWANSPWGDTYSELWETHLDVALGGVLHVELTLVEWVNDALMAVFFFLVGMEIKRELVLGELRDPRAAALPAIAALGGMIVPAGLYLALNAGEASSHGWGIPMATDIAFAVGVVALVGNRISSGAKVFLLTLAIADDIGAIAVIAVFYTDDLALGWLAGAVGLLAVVAVAKRLDIRSLPVYLVLGVAVWFTLHESGIHATLAGVALGLMTPVWSFYDPRNLADDARGLINRIDATANGELTHDDLEENTDMIEDLTRLTTETLSPLDRIEHKLSPWVAFGIVPVFALANAGVELTADALGGAATEPVVLGIALGLVVGKTVGIVGATFVAARLGLGRLPARTTWRHVWGLAVTAGIGFTVALFVAGLAFEDPAFTADAKIGILGGSLVAGLLGYGLLRTAPEAPDDSQPGESSVAGTQASAASMS